MKLQLEKHGRICFLGDSITANGLWIAEITEFFMRNYPEKEIELYNCGISGSKGYEANIKNRIYTDCFNLFPKYVVIMFGMNDVMRLLYDPNCNELDKVKKREEQLIKYRSTLEMINNLCKNEGIIPIFCSPTAYDEYNLLWEENNFADVAIKTCRDTVEEYTKENGLLFVDMYNMMIEHIKEKPVGDDRVHPNGYGHHLMSEAFLVAIGAKEVAEPEKECTLSEKNKKRYEVEQKIRNIMFVERDFFLWQYSPSLTLNERKKKVAERMDVRKEKWVTSALSGYLKNVDYLDELRGELVRLTKNLYRD